QGAPVIAVTVLCADDGAIEKLPANDDPLGLKGLQMLGEHLLGCIGNGAREVGETHGAGSQQPQDARFPFAADDTDGQHHRTVGDLVDVVLGHDALPFRKSLKVAALPRRLSQTISRNQNARRICAMCGSSVMESVVNEISRRELVKLGAAAAIGISIGAAQRDAHAQAWPSPRLGASHETMVRLPTPMKLSAANLVDLTHTLNKDFPIIPVPGITFPFAQEPIASLEKNGVFANKW